MSSSPASPRPGRDAAVEQAPVAPRRILVPIDFSDHSKYALAYASRTAVAFGSELILLYVVEPAVYPADLGFGQVSLPNIERELTERAGAELKELAAAHAGPVRSVRTLVRTGRPFIEILETARSERVDLIVIATHGHTGVEHLLFGSTTEKVVKKAHCPVLIVRQMHER
ncbi:MAG TPA: universal stress protein [Bacteroidota bacterium]|nr:universal stress protein [Bacteroidota bacterium]